MSKILVYVAGVSTDQLGLARLILFGLFIVANVGVVTGVVMEREENSHATKLNGWRLLVISLGMEIFFSSIAFGIDLEIGRRQGIEIAELNLARFQLEKEVSWRTIDEKQAAILRAALSGKNVQGHLMMLNATDPEQVQFVSKIVDLCGKIPDVGCQVHLSNWQASSSFTSFPYRFTGVMWFVSNEASASERLFVQAFKDAGIATQELGGMPAWKLFPPEVKAGILVMAKPDPIEHFSWSKQPAQP